MNIKELNVKIKEETRRSIAGDKSAPLRIAALMKMKENLLKLEKLRK